MAELDLCFSFTVKAKIAELAAQGRVFRIPELNGKFKFLIRSGIAARGNDRFADDQAAARDAVCDGGIQISVTVADRLFASLQRVAFVRTPKVSIGILPEQEILDRIRVVNHEGEGPNLVADLLPALRLVLVVGMIGLLLIRAVAACRQVSGQGGLPGRRAGAASPVRRVAPAPPGGRSVQSASQVGDPCIALAVVTGFGAPARVLELLVARQRLSVDQLTADVSGAAGAVHVAGALVSSVPAGSAAAAVSGGAVFAEALCKAAGRSCGGFVGVAGVGLRSSAPAAVIRSAYASSAAAAGNKKRPGGVPGVQARVVLGIVGADGIVDGVVLGGNMRHTAAAARGPVGTGVAAAVPAAARGSPLADSSAAGEHVQHLAGVQVKDAFRIAACAADLSTVKSALCAPGLKLVIAVHGRFKDLDRAVNAAFLVPSRVHNRAVEGEVANDLHVPRGING